MPTYSSTFFDCFQSTIRDQRYQIFEITADPENYQCPTEFSKGAAGAIKAKLNEEEMDIFEPISCTEFVKETFPEFTAEELGQQQDEILLSMDFIENLGGDRKAKHWLEEDGDVFRAILEGKHKASDVPIDVFGLHYLRVPARLLTSPDVRAFCVQANRNIAKKRMHLHLCWHARKVRPEKRKRSVSEYGPFDMGKQFKDIQPCALAG